MQAEGDFCSQKKKRRLILVFAANVGKKKKVRSFFLKALSFPAIGFSVIKSSAQMMNGHHPAGKAPGIFEVMLVWMMMG